MAFMKSFAFALAFLLACMASLASAADRTSLDLGWKFHLGNAADPAKDFGYGTGSIYAKSGEGVGPIRSGFDDNLWRTVDVPHDWAIELPFVPDAPDLVGHGSKPLGGRYPESSIGWYRKSFTVPAGSEAANKRYRIDFDGVFRDCRVWLNGHFLGQHESGYSGFAYDVNDWINFTGKNVLTVRVDATENEGWFYEGAGIYRHVWLTASNPVHIARQGVYVIPTEKDGMGRLKFFVAVQNDSDKATACLLTFSVRTPTGETLDSMAQSGAVTDFDPGELIPARSSKVFMRVFYIQHPALWSIETPQLYGLQVRLDNPRSSRISGSESSGVGRYMLFGDAESTSFGFRTIRFDKDQGFFLNGMHVEIKGTCNHQDHAGVGAGVPDAINEYRIRRLKAMGSNAYRSSHNDPTPSVLDACDKLGMVVMDEHRLMDSNPPTLEDLQELVRRDRNHPCVIMWSIGNEEPILGTEIGHRIALTMKRTIHKLDATRPISCAANNGNGYEGVNEVMDLRGWNYVAGGNTNDYHAAHPMQPIYGSEEASTLSTRGIYSNDRDAGYVSAYDVNKPGWGALAEWWWKYYMARPFLAGAFVWTGFDYRGEPTPYSWPCISSHFGIMDTCGFPKDNFYYYLAQWGDKPVVHLLPHWNWPGLEGKEIEVWAQTNCDSVELFLNGKSVAHFPVGKYGHFTAKVKYEPGTLEAKGLSVGGAVVASDVIKTSGAAAKLVLTPDRTSIRADGEDADVFNVSVVDKDGNPVPTAGNKLDFDLDGPARIIGVGNGDPSDHDPDTFVSTPQGLRINGWQMASAANDAPTGETFAVKATGEARNVNIGREPYQIRDENTSALFSAEFEVTQEDLDHGINVLNIGAIDDEGWVYVNDHLVGHANDWSANFTYEVARYLKVGKNTIRIYVRNRGGRGGVGQGVGLSGPDIPAKFSRRLFNGLAQVIVRAGTKPGAVRLSVTSKGLEPATVGIHVTLATPQ